MTQSHQPQSNIKDLRPLHEKSEASELPKMNLFFVKKLTNIGKTISRRFPPMDLIFHAPTFSCNGFDFYFVKCFLHTPKSIVVKGFLFCQVFFTHKIHRIGFSDSCHHGWILMILIFFTKFFLKGQILGDCSRGLIGRSFFLCQFIVYVIQAMDLSSHTSP